ncbi:hypothetical protein TSH100_07155 [Azospirillum sp. TSH100]|uniref:hypothetical protein n=1 Tax=Azospirillum sp. TSH100 TaxID=652764 RepID=UPI000D61DD1E|nr:hypothetical protein [Azospirillum sp. TSH100]PWC88686.1 hypothetical protein TSH100_07155 [Azospirillum sp. TSH100]QCG86962.1 hypothetical protein E6C72_03955 [Azospirillum sp. TSH100]
MNAAATMQEPQMPRTAMRRVVLAATQAAGIAGAVLLFGAALSTPSLADPGEHGRGHAWGHHKKHHHDDDGPVVIYGAPPPVVVVPAPPPPPRVVYAPSYAPPPVIYAPPPPQPGVSVQMNIPLR